MDAGPRHMLSSVDGARLRRPFDLSAITSRQPLTELAEAFSGATLELAELPNGQFEFSTAEEYARTLGVIEKNLVSLQGS
jgi:hypothetical protein